NVQLGPGVCLARVPLNGRNFEYISGEDPFLGATLVGPAVKGIQSQGVIANAKHWVDNNQETHRGWVSAQVDERTQFEMYYPPFEAAIKAGAHLSLLPCALRVGSIMCSYNKIGGVYSCEKSSSLLRDLKGRLGFKGWVMSDWGATHSSSINEGLDQAAPFHSELQFHMQSSRIDPCVQEEELARAQEMPGETYMGDKLAALVAAGNVSIAKVDESAGRILTAMFATGLFDNPNNNSPENNVTSEEHNKIAQGTPRLLVFSILLSHPPSSPLVLSFLCLEALPPSACDVL
ncbi:MAG: hypothetical protein SGPRY_014887, partial [Prymnesium sp.]